MVTSSSAAVLGWAAILVYDQQIDELAQAHPDFALLKSFPGAGPVMTPRLIAALGSQRERYQSAAQIQQYSGIAPVVASSGKLRWVHWRWACPKFLCQTFHQWALHSIAYSAWAREYALGCFIGGGSQLGTSVHRGHWPPGRQVSQSPFPRPPKDGGEESPQKSLH